MAEHSTASKTSPGEDQKFLEEASTSTSAPETEVTRRLGPSEAREPDDGEFIETVQLHSREHQQEPVDGFRPLGHFGKYEILEKIGAGGFGLVQRGRDPILKRMVAIKTCTSEQERVRQRFFREAQISAGLQHPNITTVHDLGFEEGVPFLVQEFLSGEDLSAKIERREALPTSTRLDYLLQIARGLHHAHESGVLHRDVKPGNVRVLENGRVKLLDFGIARLEEEENPITTEGVAIGTVGYLSPEQLEGGKVDRRTDIFAYGVLAYELLAYQRPFPGNKFSEVAFKLMFEAPTPLGEIWPDCPAALDELVGRCLAKEREQRCESFVEVIELLEEILEAISPGTRPSAARPALITSSEVRAQHHRRNWFRRAGVAAAMAAMVAAGWLLWNSGSAREAAVGALEPRGEAPSEATTTPQLPVNTDSTAKEISAEPDVEAPSESTDTKLPKDHPQPPPGRREPSGPSTSFTTSPSPPALETLPPENPPPSLPEEPRDEVGSLEATTDAESHTAVDTVEPPLPEEKALMTSPSPTPADDDPKAGTLEESAAASAPKTGENDPAPSALRGLEVKPQVLERGEAVYPKRAQRRRKEGQVVVGVRVGKNGEVLQTLLKSSSTLGFGFEEAAREAALVSRFSPGTRDGVPASMWVEMVFAFRLP